MRKLYRSLLAVGALATLAACGDDVSITEPPENVEISGAPVTAIKVGDVVQLSANVAVTWSTSAQSVASVDANSGLVTAVSAGIASITATSTTDQTKKASVTITVSGSVAPSVSIASVNAFGTGLPVNPNAVAGQVNVVVNMDPGDFTVQSLELLLDGNVVDQQDFSAAATAAAVEGDANAVQQVTFALNTADFNTTTGVAAHQNGSHALSARVVVTGGGTAGSAAPTKTLVFNNQPGIVFTLTNDNGTSPATAINSASGLSWIGGSVTLNVVGVSYVAGQAFSSATVNLFGMNQVIALTNGVGSVTYSEGNTWNGTQLRVGGYLSPAVEALTVVNSVLNGVAGPAGAGAILNGTNAIPAIPAIRLDNARPGANSANGQVQPAIAMGAVGPWVNASTSLLPTASGATSLGIPSLNTLNTTDLGIAGIVVEVFVPAAGGSLPTTGGSCNVTGLTMVDQGSDVAETTVSAAYPARIKFRDGLGNETCVDLGGTFGADFTAPTATVNAGPAHQTGYNAAPPAFSVTASDNASGFSATPLRVKMTRLNTDGSTDCEIGSGGSCNAAAQALSFSATDGSALDGYYTTSISIQDQAGNSVTLLTDRLYAFDDNAASFSGGISLPSQINGAATNTFTATVADNLDLGSIFGDVSYPGVGADFRYPSQGIGTFGPALEQGTTVNYAVSDWMRCVNNATDFVTTTNQPNIITLFASDQTTLPAVNLGSLASGQFGANAQACGAVGNTQAGELNSFGASAANYGTGKTEIDLDGQSVANTSSTSATLSTVADVDLNSSVDPFTRVDYYYQGAGGVWIKIGTASAVLAQTQTNRTYTYSLTWDPGAEVPTGAVTVSAVGVDAQGDAVFGGNFVVQIVP